MWMITGLTDVTPSEQYKTEIESTSALVWESEKPVMINENGKLTWLLYIPEVWIITASVNELQ